MLVEQAIRNEDPIINNYYKHIHEEPDHFRKVSLGKKYSLGELEKICGYYNENLNVKPEVRFKVE